MKILVLNGSPRKQGTTAAMCSAFCEGAEAAGHEVNLVRVCEKKISGCLACEYCHNAGKGHCVQQDDMQELYPLMEEMDMLVIASPIYYYSYSGQMQCALNRIYALDRPKNLKKTALLLTAGDANAFEGAIFAYNGNFPGYLKTENMGIFTISRQKKNQEEELVKIREMASALRD